MVGGDNLSSLWDVDQGFTDVGEIRFCDNFDIGNTAMGHETGPWIQTYEF